MKLKRAWLGEHTLKIAGIWRTIEVPLQQISAVTQPDTWKQRGGSVVEVSFKVPTLFGQRIRFTVPASPLGGKPFQDYPEVIALRWAISKDHTPAPDSTF